MVQPIDIKHTTPDFRGKLDDILSSTLTPENIDEYAEKALHGLVRFSLEAVFAYDKQPTVSREATNAHEDAAFDYFNVQNINTVLAHVSAKAEEVRQIETVIANATHKDQVFLPPDKPEHQTGSEENAEAVEKQVVPRLKAFLFILKNDFGIDLDDTDQLSLSTGTLSSNMRRGESYYQVNLPTLGRTALICDEEGNITYVFDNQVLQKEGLPTEEVNSFSKNELNDFIAINPHIGTRITYTSRYLQKMALAMNRPLETIRTANGENGGQYLIIDAPEGYLSAKGFADILEIGEDAVRRSIDYLKEDGLLDRTMRYRFNNTVTFGYSPSEQEQILEHLDNRGALTVNAKHGTLSVAAMARDYGYGVKLIREAIAELGDQLGEVRRYRFAGQITEGFDEQQQELILKYSTEIARDQPPEGYLHEYGLSQIFGSTNHVVRRVAKEMAAGLGDIGVFRSTRRRTQYFSPRQQEIIRSRLEADGFFLPPAPEDTVSMISFSKQLGINFSVVSKIAAEIEDFGELRRYKFTNVPGIGIDHQQQQLLLDALKQRGSLATKPPEGVISIRKLAKSMRMSDLTVSKVLHELEPELGELAKYKFNTTTTVGLDEQQQQIVISYLEASGYNAPEAPDGVVSIRRLSKSWHTSTQRIERIISENEEQIGTVGNYRFNNNLSRGLTPEQQAILKVLLAK